MGPKLDGSLGLRGPRTQWLWVLYELSLSKVVDAGKVALTNRNPNPNQALGQRVVLLTLTLTLALALALTLTLNLTLTLTLPRCSA